MEFASTDQSVTDILKSFITFRHIQDTKKGCHRCCHLTAGTCGCSRHPDDMRNAPDCHFSSFWDYRLRKQRLDAAKEDGRIEPVFSSQTTLSMLRTTALVTIVMIMLQTNTTHVDHQWIGISLAMMEFVNHVLNNSARIKSSIVLPFSYKKGLLRLQQRAENNPFSHLLFLQYPNLTVANALENPKFHEQLVTAMHADQMYRSAINDSISTRPHQNTYLGAILMLSLLSFSVFITAWLFPSADKKSSTTEYLIWGAVKLLVQFMLMNRSYHEQMQSPDPVLEVRYQAANTVEALAKRYHTIHHNDDWSQSTLAKNQSAFFRAANPQGEEKQEDILTISSPTEKPTVKEWMLQRAEATQNQKVIAAVEQVLNYSDSQPKIFYYLLNHIVEMEAKIALGEIEQSDYDVLRSLWNPYSKQKQDSLSNSMKELVKYHLNTEQPHIQYERQLEI